MRRLTEPTQEDACPGVLGICCEEPPSSVNNGFWRGDPYPACPFPPAFTQAQDPNLGVWGRLFMCLLFQESLGLGQEWGASEHTLRFTWALLGPQWDSKEPQLNATDKVLLLLQRVCDNGSTQIGLAPRHSLYLRC